MAKSSQHFSIYIKDNSFTIAAVTVDEQEKYNISCLFTREFDNHADLLAKLEHSMALYKLDDFVGCIVLDNKCYKLVTSRLPNLPEKEISDALKWELLDKTTYTEQEMLVDTICVHQDSNVFLSVVTDINQVLSLINILESQNCFLKMVEIVESSLCALAEHTKENQTSAMLVKMYGIYKLIIHKNKKLLFSRDLLIKKSSDKVCKDNSHDLDNNNKQKNINTSYVSQDSNADYKTTKLQLSKEVQIKQIVKTRGMSKSIDDLQAKTVDHVSDDNFSGQIVKEIRRSLDYCRNNLGIDYPEEILLLECDNSLIDTISKMLSISARSFKSEYINKLHCSIEELVALGGVLRGANVK